MSKLKDLTGLVFGSWTVLKRAENKNKQTHWVCKCVCNGEHSLKDILHYSLIRGESQSCGCLRQRLQDFTGTKFGKLTVIKLSDVQKSNKNKKRFWDCRCECGSDKICKVTTANLKYNLVKSCGCLLKNHPLKLGVKRNTNTYEVFTDYAIIKVHKSNNKIQECIIDLEDFEKIKSFTWCDSYGYMITRLSEDKAISMHRFIMNVHEKYDKVQVDHIDGNPHNNRKNNLRLVSNQQNSMNTALRKNNKSGVKGVFWNNQKKKWQAIIINNQKTIHLGFFIDIEDARLAREKAELELFGEYSALHRKKVEDVG